MKKIFIGIMALAVLAVLTTEMPSPVHAATIFACKNNSDGTLRIVSSGTTCKKNETMISWPDTESDLDTLGDLTCSAGQTVKFNGTAWVCESNSALPRFELRTHTSGVQTIYDNNTGLEWEIKVSCSDPNNPRCDENKYSWSVGAGSSEPNGTLFTDFLKKLNNSTGSMSSDGTSLSPAGCYAGHCDWRIPDIVELRTIIDLSRPGCPNPSTPCINSIFDPTPLDTDTYSSTTQTDPTLAWWVFFGNGDAGTVIKTATLYARAVRGGR